MQKTLEVDWLIHYVKNSFLLQVGEPNNLLKITPN